MREIARTSSPYKQSLITSVFIEMTMEIETMIPASIQQTTLFPFLPVMKPDSNDYHGPNPGKNDYLPLIGSSAKETTEASGKQLENGFSNCPFNQGNHVNENENTAEFVRNLR
ncbi:hypothetical protein BaRGS_00009627 [Batillaria attramentaria]|uniref:Uncharacterized protein n=1 Tax=Batillaria attramentaria TaxID=370345 RepID=A0ABD0LI92_9CAEN